LFIPAKTITGKEIKIVALAVAEKGIEAEAVRNKLDCLSLHRLNLCY
jgi:hypothetical protein